MVEPASVRVLMVANEYPWPPTHGGRKRMARVAESLAGRVELVVASAGPEDPAGLCHPPELRWRSLPTSPVSRAEQVTRPSEPLIGRRLIAGAGGELRRIAEEFAPDIVYWSHSYLPAVRPDPFSGLPVKHVVEFPNIEQRRFRSMAETGTPAQRASAWLEAQKARRWESRVARSAHAVVSINNLEAAELATKAPWVIVALNGFDPAPYSPSPDASVVMAVGSWDYRPNSSALKRFLRVEWPRVLRAEPSATLRVVGRGASEFASLAPNVEAVGFVDDLSVEYAAATVVLAPATSGAGSQLKVAEALSHGRVVVGPAFLGREARPDLPDGAIRASEDVATTLVEVLRLGASRHELERTILTACRASGWDDIGRALSFELARMV